MIAYRNDQDNWIAQAEPEDNLSNSEVSVFARLLSEMEDCVIMGEEYCLSNFDMAVDLYDYYTGKVVHLPYSEMDKLRAGETVTFYAREPEYHKGDLVSLFHEDDPYRIIYIGPKYAMCKREDNHTCIVTLDMLSPYID